MNKYEEWISRLPADVKSQCAERTLEMQEQFPELIRVRGHYHDLLLGPRPHWWLKTVSGEIVDPTARQFMAGGDYEEWDEDEPEPTGKCPNCGEYCYDGKTLCSERCAHQYMAYLKSETR